MNPFLVMCSHFQTLLKLLLAGLFVVTFNHHPIDAQAISDKCVEESGALRATILSGAGSNVFGNITCNNDQSPRVCDYSAYTTAVESVCNNAGGKFFELSPDIIWSCQIPSPTTISLVNYGDCAGASCNQSEVQDYVLTLQSYVLVTFGLVSCVPVSSPSTSGSSPTSAPQSTPQAPIASSPTASQPTASTPSPPVASTTTPNTPVPAIPTTVGSPATSKVQGPTSAAAEHSRRTMNGSTPYVGCCFSSCCWCVLVGTLMLIYLSP